MADALLDAPQGTRMAVDSLHQLQAPGAFGAVAIVLGGTAGVGRPGEGPHAATTRTGLRPAADR
jgi:hypothetical protein